MLGVYRGGSTEQGGGRNWGQKFREEGENEKLWEWGDIDEKGILEFSNLRDDKGWGGGEFDVQHCDPLGSPGSPGTPLDGLH